MTATPTTALAAEVAADVAAIGRLESVELVLRVLARATGLRIALVTRITPDSWTCCAALDEADFGIQPGDTLDLATTY